MEFMLWMMMMSTMIFMFMKHPMSMGLILLTQTTLISLTTSLMSLNSWFSYILFLVMVGGMLILFIYMTSIASNEMFKHSNTLMISIMTMMMLSTMTILIKDFMFNFEFMTSNNMLFNYKNEFPIILNKFLSFPSMMIWILMIIYLLITLIAVVKISMIKYGPLRQQS